MSAAGLSAEPSDWRGIVESARRLVGGVSSQAVRVERLLLVRSGLADALAAVLADALQPETPVELFQALYGALVRHPSLLDSALEDLRFRQTLEPSPAGPAGVLLYVPSFHALQVQRIGHALLGEGQAELAFILRHRAARAFAMDLHPGAQIAPGVFVDHGIGLVIGETALVESSAMLLHGVTLGSTMTHGGNRHPKVRAHSVIGAGATVLGSLEVGSGAFVAACSVVLHDVPPGKLVAGAPARVIGEAPQWIASLAGNSGDASP